MIVLIIRDLGRYLSYNGILKKLKIIGMAAHPMEKNKIQLKLEPSEPMRIRVDVGQFKQVFINLIQNAADSIGRDGGYIASPAHDVPRDARPENVAAMIDTLQGQ